jgi:hypothetical protein
VAADDDTTVAGLLVAVATPTPTTRRPLWPLSIGHLSSAVPRPLGKNDDTLLVAVADAHADADADETADLSATCRPLSLGHLSTAVPRPLVAWRTDADDTSPQPLAHHPNYSPSIGRHRRRHVCLLSWPTPTTDGATVVGCRGRRLRDVCRLLWPTIIKDADDTTLRRCCGCRRRRHDGGRRPFKEITIHPNY